MEVIYHKHNYLPELWTDIELMITENYSRFIKCPSVIMLGSYLHQSVEDVRELYPGKKIIIYQLEPLVENHWFKPEYIIDRIKHADEIWDYDISNIRYIKSKNMNAKFRPFLYSEKLKRIKENEDPSIDVLFYGNLDGQRDKWLRHITMIPEYEYRVLYLKNFIGDELDKFIQDSKVVINLNHRGYEDIQKQVRIFYLLCNNKCVLSERTRINYFPENLFPNFESKSELTESLRNLVQLGGWKQYSKKTSERFKRYSSAVLHEIKIQEENWSYHEG